MSTLTAKERLAILKAKREGIVHPLAFADIKVSQTSQTSQAQNPKAALAVLQDIVNTAPEQMQAPPAPPANLSQDSERASMSETLPTNISQVPEHKAKTSDANISTTTAPASKGKPSIEELKAKLAAARLAVTKPIEKTISLAEQLNQKAHSDSLIAEAVKQANISLAQTDFNAEQMQAITLSEEGQSLCLIGAAGTGKTTAVKEIVRRVLKANPVDNNKECVALVSFTNRAVSNIIRAVSTLTETAVRDRAISCCKTIHKLLEFSPVYYEVQVPNDKGGFSLRQTMRFEPTWRAERPLLHIKLLVIDEASMLGLTLYKQLIEACPNARIIFIGDLNQLKPVMDDSILGYKLGELPVVELTQVYRQAMESPIVSFQHKYTLAGRQLGDISLADVTAQSNGQLIFKPIKDPRTPETLSKVFANAMLKHMDAGEYTPGVDAILLPNYKGFGSFLVGQYIAQELGRRRHAIVYEIAANKHPLTDSNKRYFAVGDFVIHNKEEYYIADIRPNANYTGRELQQPDIHMSRTGSILGGHSKAKLQDFEEVMWDVAEGTEQREVCSHYITLVPSRNSSSLQEAQNKLSADMPAVTLSTRGDVGDLEFGYAITVHKSQGSEWPRVFLAFAKHARNMLTRELLYTAMTRARTSLYVYYSPDAYPGAGDNTIGRCIRNQAIPGRTWKEKLKSFDLKRAEYEAFMLAPTEYGV